MAEVRGLVAIFICGTILLFPVSASSQLAVSSTESMPASLQSVSSRVDRWTPFIAEASKRFGIPVAWIKAVMRVESDGQTVFNGAPITSPAGAMGLMQVMPGTYADMQNRFGLGVDPYDPQDNITAGVAFLREMYLRYGYPNLFAAYNAGPTRFDRYLYAGVSLPAETMAYLKALDQLEFALPQPAEFSVGNNANSREQSSDAADRAASDFSFKAPGTDGLIPSSLGLFVALKMQSSDQP